MLITNKTDYKAPYAGRSFNVRIVRSGDKYGRDHCLTHAGEPMVAFDDADSAGSSFGPLGQFVSRYYVSTLAERPKHTGLNLEGGVEVWTVDEDAMELVLDHLETLTD